MGASRGRRTGLILIILILLILIIGVAAIFFLQNVLGGGADEPQEVEVIPTATPPPPINVIVAARDIPRGAQIGIQDVTTIPWPDLAEAPPPIDALIATEGEGFGLEQVQDRIARVDILKGQPVLNFMLTPGDEPIGLADSGSDAALLVPSGSVMMTIPISRLSAAGYALREGDHVDILASVQFVDVDEEFQTILPNRLQIITDNTELIAAGLQSLEYQEGREEAGPFGSTLLIMPNQNDLYVQRPRAATQLLIDNAIVLRMGDWPIEDIYQPIVITPAPPPTAVPEDQAAPEGEVVAEETPPPTPTPIPVPDSVSLALSRQDALVLKYALEQGAVIDLALRSALDDNVNDITTDTVTLEYIIQFYNIAVPNPLPQALEPGTVQDLLNALSVSVTEPVQ